jgi:glyoxylase-like metal-dependent hydrolase (beta-lactamase superfamily II)
MEVDRVLAPNPGFFTGPGTNTYLIGSEGEVVVLDPGPVIDDHRRAILDAIGDRNVVGVAVTHTHPDHAPLANPLAAEVGAPAIGYGPGPGFTPDIRLGDLGTLSVGTLRLTAIHTPGHTADHLCYLVDDVLFSGDHIMGGSTVVIEDAAAYLSSLERLAGMDLRFCHPGHGPDLPDAAATIDDYIAHRRLRERQIVDAVRGGARTVDDIVDAVYDEVPSEWRFAAVMQVRTQLEKLDDEGRVRWDAADGEVGGVRLAEDS